MFKEEVTKISRAVNLYTSCSIFFFFCDNFIFHCDLIRFSVVYKRYGVGRQGRASRYKTFL